MIGLRPGLQAFRQAPPAAGTISVATFAELPAPATVPVDTVGLVGSEEETAIYISDGTDWIAQRLLVDTVGELPDDAADGAMALVGTSTPLATRLPYVREAAAWEMAGPTIRALSSLTDVLSTDLDGAAATYTDPITGAVQLLRLTPAMALPGGGTRRFWLPQDVYSWSGLTCRSYLDGGETMPGNGSAIQGNIVIKTGSANVASSGGVIRLSSSLAGNVAGLQSQHVLSGGRFYARCRMRVSLAAATNQMLYLAALDQGVGQPQLYLTQNPTLNGAVLVPSNAAGTFQGSNIHISAGGSALPSVAYDTVEMVGVGAGSALVSIRRNGLLYVGLRRNMLTGGSTTTGQRLVQLLTTGAGSAFIDIADDIFFTGT